MEQLYELIKIIASIISAVTIIGAFLYKKIKNMFNELNENNKKQIEILQNKLSKIDEHQCKNFLVKCLNDMDKGIDLDDVTLQRMCEVYDHYTKDIKDGGLGLNSYIHDKWISVMKERKKNEKN